MSLIHIDCLLDESTTKKSLKDGGYLTSREEAARLHEYLTDYGDGVVFINPFGAVWPADGEETVVIFNGARGGLTNFTPEDPSGEENKMNVLSGEAVFKELVNTPDKPAIYNRTRDCSSNSIVMFDISNMYYGNTIQNETFFLTDPQLTGSSEKIRITLRDNKRGGLYRCDARSPHPKWANVGNIFYEEGIGIIKSPHLMFFGNEQFEVRFKGSQNIHIFTINVPAEGGLINSSSNPLYIRVSASLDANDYDPRFVYITSVNLHDDNLNVIMRANLAQPVKKRNSDEMLIRIKEDF